MDNHRVEVVLIERRADAFQRALTVAQLEAVCDRALSGETVRCAVELGLGTYNTTYRLDLNDRSVVLRVAPEPEHAGELGAGAPRNEYAATPFLAELGELVPGIVAADFTRELLNRDYLVQTFLPGKPATEVLGGCTQPERASFYRQLGSITRRIHAVAGTRFGSVVDPAFETWSAALVAHFLNEADLYEAAGLDSTDVRGVADYVASSRETFDSVEPRLLHGDLWHINILVGADPSIPTITGICDHDRASWGDPWADWTIEKAAQRPGTERDAFWETYGPAPTDVASRTRQLVYQARNRAGNRLDIRRRGLDLTGIPRMHWDIHPLLAELRASV